MKEELNSIDPKKLKKLDRVMDLFAETKVDPIAEEPVWVENGTINEAKFVGSYLAAHPMKCVEKVLYDLDGQVDPGMLEHDIYTMIKPYLVKDVPKVLRNIMKVIEVESYAPDIPLDETHIHFQNGTYCITDESFTERKVFCRNRLPVRFVEDAPIPEDWLCFLDELFYTEDIYAIQEFLGYALIPSNRGQTMMVIVGDGGEGKSRVPLALRPVFGDNMNVIPIHKLATDRFARAEQRGKLLMIDEDMNIGKLPDTGILKSIVTLEDKIDMEIKHKQSFQGRLYVRLLAIGNTPLSALYDKSDGFFRRQLVIKVRPKPEDRVDDPFILDKLLAELEGIARWILEGLLRLISNNFRFSVSDRMKTNLEEMRKEENNILSFYESTGYIRFEKGTYALTRDLYTAYDKWCFDNLEKPFTSKTFASQLMRDQERLGIKYD